jgi:hypothetical protein
VGTSSTMDVIKLKSLDRYQIYLILIIRVISTWAMPSLTHTTQYSKHYFGLTPPASSTPTYKAYTDIRKTPTVDTSIKERKLSKRRI